LNDVGQTAILGWLVRYTLTALKLDAGHTVRCTLGIFVRPPLLQDPALVNELVPCA